MEKENRLTFIDEEGNEILCEILFTFESKEFNKNYVLFYPVDGEDEDIEVMAASYTPSENGEGELQAIETDEEWEMIEKVLEQFDEESEEGDCCCSDEECEDEECEDEECCCDDDEEEEEDHQCCCNHKHER